MSGPGDDIERGRVVEAYGRRCVVTTGSGERRPAAVFGKRQQIVCGDEVSLAHHAGSDELQVVAALPRRTEIARADSRGRTEPLAANVTLLAVVIAPEPAPDLYMVDRYLAAAAYAGVAAALILNKVDLVEDGAATALLEEFAAAGYPLFGLSALGADAAARGLPDSGALATCLHRHVTLLVGQSGVGKSTLCNRLVPTSIRPTQTLSPSTGEGRHTTVAAMLLDLPGGGQLVDSPGVRDFAPPPVAEDRVQEGWPEIVAASVRCRFKDCRHLREPACAVLAAVAAGTLSPRRYEGYRRLCNLMRQLMPSHERPR